jgi:hypothetical protein
MRRCCTPLRSLATCTCLPQIPSCDDLYCKTYFSSGPDWAVIGVRAIRTARAHSLAHFPHVQGSEEGYSQMARKTTGGEPLVVWNFPIDRVRFMLARKRHAPRLSRCR